MTDTIAVRFTDEDKKQAAVIDKAIKTTLKEAHEAYSQMMHSFSKVGRLLTEVKLKQYWRLWGFESYGKYIVSIEDLAGKGRTQLYQAASVAENLLPYITSDTLDQIGISKAIELKRVVEAGRTPSKALVAKAADKATTIPQLREAVFEELHIDQKLDPKGKFFDLGGFHVTSAERAEIQAAFKLAARQEPPIPHNWPEHLQRKEILLRMSRECISSWSVAE